MTARVDCAVSTLTALGSTLDRTLELVPPFDIEAIVSDTAGSALTGRHQPAAREYSHLFGLSRVRMHLLSAWFQRGTGDS
jgi:hypothetical protein